MNNDKHNYPTRRQFKRLGMLTEELTVTLRTLRWDRLNIHRMNLICDALTVCLDRIKKALND